MRGRDPEETDGEATPCRPLVVHHNQLLHFYRRHYSVMKEHSEDPEPEVGPHSVTTGLEEKKLIYNRVHSARTVSFR